MVDPSKEYCVYKIQNKIDFGTYIGITKDLNRRIREHRKESSNKYLRAAINLHGWDAFSVTVLTTATFEDISDIEVKYISEIRDTGIPVYNISDGGLFGSATIKGEQHWNAEISEEDIYHIRVLYASNTITQRRIAEQFNIGYKNISKIVRGDRWKDAPGPITTNKLSISKVANRRKLTDEQVVTIRMEAQEEFLMLGTINIPEIADMYNIARGNMRLLLLGKVYPDLGGPILRRDYYESFGK